MGEEAAASESGIPQLLMSNTLVLNGALFLGILALHTLLEDSTINNNLVSTALLAMALALLIKSADVFIEGAKGLAHRATHDVVENVGVTGSSTIAQCRQPGT